ncbi:DUF4383 domain-containing protein [Nesterenkonia lutea]|uniref:DUF4383 domain-containing protein n=1 Tax=Nesterenkonia lutea TaxID=272919 RepID=A0ABR9JBW2_9MICC|nr:DUF4383 domain-containing protein [Nesterenkonia lutea]MBE1523427.1 hypothetical protein [Nesterenkonia lutea]
MTTSDTHPDRTRSRKSPVQLAALLYAVVFLLVGVAGFIPGVTTGYDTMQFIGHHSEAMLLGIFQVSILHNIVHLLYGVLGVIMARTGGAARVFLRWGGAVYLLLWLYGLFIDKDSAANFVPLNSADDWLHLVLGVTMIALSFLPRHANRAEVAERRGRPRRR